MADNTIDSEVDQLLQYFWPFPYPEHKPPIEVVFSNGLPESDHDPDHMVFQMPYNTFKAAITNLIAQEANKARLDEAHIALSLNEGSQAAQLDRIAQLRTLTADKEQAALQNKTNDGGSNGG